MRFEPLIEDVWSDDSDEEAEKRVANLNKTVTRRSENQEVLDVRNLSITAPGTSQDISNPTVAVVNSRHIRFGPTSITVTNSINNTETVKVSCCCLELETETRPRKYRCSVAWCVCCSLTFTSALALYGLLLATTFQTRLDIGFSQYVVSFCKGTTTTERISFAVVLVLVLLCISVGVYYGMVIVPHKNEKKDYAPHPWNITREMWMAREVNNTESTAKYEPLRVVVIQHTAVPECRTYEQCAAAMLELQCNYLEGDDPQDIPYNFIVGNDGRVYEARGWGIAGSHSKWLNPCAMAVAFMGDYRDEIAGLSKVTDLQLNRTLMLLEYGVKVGYLHPDYVVMGAKDFRDTDSPGSNLYEAIKKWDHYFKDRKYKEQTCDQLHFNLTDEAPHEWWITREMWEARPFTNEKLSESYQPVRLVIIHNSISSECHYFDNCKITIQHLQIYYNFMDQDVPYNFIIGNEGRVYESRGWGVDGGRSPGYNPCVLTIGFLGEYSEKSKYNTKVTEAQMNRTKLLLERGVEEGHLDSDYVIANARDMFPTTSPGQNLYEAIQQLSHYDTRYQNMSCKDIYGIQEEMNLNATEPDEEPQEWFISRAEWQASPFLRQELAVQFQPVRLVLVHNSITDECHSFSQCKSTLQQMQSWFHDSNNADVPYNFIIGNDGRVYEARGWEFDGGQSREYNPCSFSIGFLGEYCENSTYNSIVSELQMTRTKLLLDEGVEQGHLDPDYVISNARDMFHTTSPGQNLYEAIQQLSHYDTRYHGMICEDIYGIKRDVDEGPVDWFISREMWEARPFSNQALSRRYQPVRLVIVQNSVTAECHSFASCKIVLQNMQIWFHSSQQVDIPYNFIIGNDGRVYESRGWGFDGGNSRQYDPCAISVGFLGEYSEDSTFNSTVTEAQLKSVKKLLDEGMDLGHLDTDFAIANARDMFPTSSPGQNLYEAIQQLAHHDNRYQDMTCEKIYKIDVNENVDSAESELDGEPQEWFISRAVWQASPFLRQELAAQFQPVRLVLVHNSITDECHSFSQCKSNLQQLQKWFNSYHNLDLPYNFIVGNDGRVYEARGWGFDGGHSREHNQCSISIGFLGEYSADSTYNSTVTADQIKTTKLLLQKGVEEGHLDPDYVVTNARDMFPTTSPGQNLYEAIQQLSHYDTRYRDMTCEQIYEQNSLSILDT